MPGAIVARRTLLRLAALAATALATPGTAWASTPPSRIVALEWSVAAMLLSLGVMPVGVADAGLYRSWVGEPELPPAIPDVGLRTEPNLERVADLRPDLILTSPLGATTRPLLERIAPTREIAIYTSAKRPLEEAAARLRELGAWLGQQSEAEATIEETEVLLWRLRNELASRGRRPLLFIQFLDQRHVRVHGPGSLFDAVATRLGLMNAWTGTANLWGFALAGTEQLAAYPQAGIVVVDPLPAGISLDANPASLWGNLPAVTAGRVLHLQAAWAFGDLTAAQHFARLLGGGLLGTEKLLTGDSGAPG